MKRPKEIVELSTGDTVTIDEILKDDPKALGELRELRKWMDENPGLFQFQEEKRTQGQKKMKQLLEDARRDTVFGKKLGKIIEAGPSYDHRELELLYIKYRWFLAELAKFRKQHLKKDRAHKLKISLAREYGIDPVLLDRLLFAFKDKQLEGWDFSEETSSDMATLEPQDENELPQDIHTFHLRTVDRIENEVYPAVLKIHLFASKRDVLDFIEKNWKQIASLLKEKRIKERKLPREVLDFVWKHRSAKAIKIASLLDENFPKYHMIDYEINRVLNDERRRRKTEKL